MAFAKYLRFATYGMLVASLFIASGATRLIPLSLNSPQWLAADAARVANKNLIEDVTVLECTRSGRDVLARATRLLVARRWDAFYSPIPHVKLQKVGGRVRWHLTYPRFDPPPGGSSALEIAVDDLTGETTILSP